ncbi:MAG: hypothetical protein AAF500_00090 [Myxococcota bacterium]
MTSTSTNTTGLLPVLRVAAGALVGRVSIPLSLVRNRLAQISGEVDIEVAPEPPGLRIRGRAHALGAPIEFSAHVAAEGIGVRGEARIVSIRINDVMLSTPSDAPGPLADAIRQGSIDTDNPATLVGNMAALPDFIVEAHGNTVVVDLMRVPAVANDETVQTLAAAATSYVGISRIDVDQDSIVLGLRAFPGGVREAALSTARAALAPAVRFLWPSGRPAK